MEYTLAKDPGRTDRTAQPALIRVLTTICDPNLAPAAELATLYQQRWECQTAWMSSRPASAAQGGVAIQVPEMVAQEVWGMLLVHHAIRRLMHQAALDHQVDPTGCRLSAACGSSAARSAPPARRPFPLVASQNAQLVRREIAERRLPARRLRAFPRVVKRKMSNFGVKRATHRTRPQLTLPPTEAVVIVGASKPTPIHPAPTQHHTPTRYRRDGNPSSTEPAEHAQV
jgi:hypothetical protein